MWVSLLRNSHLIIALIELCSFWMVTCFIGSRLLAFTFVEVVLSPSDLALCFVSFPMNDSQSKMRGS